MTNLFDPSTALRDAEAPGEVRLVGIGKYGKVYKV
jgi:hypothetical protein